MGSPPPRRRSRSGRIDKLPARPRVACVRAAIPIARAWSVALRNAAEREAELGERTDRWWEAQEGDVQVLADGARTSRTDAISGGIGRYAGIARAAGVIGAAADRNAAPKDLSRARSALVA